MDKSDRAFESEFALRTEDRKELLYQVFTET